MEFSCDDVMSDILMTKFMDVFPNNV